jgi:hypothetical protein
VIGNTVFILGAGASKEAGAPLMNDFLDAADLLHRTGRIPDPADQIDFELVAEGRAALDAVYAKASIDSDNLESVFGAFEMAAMFRQDLGRLSMGEVGRLPDAIRRVIVRTLEESMAFRINDVNKPVAPDTCNQFVDVLGHMQKAGASPTVITFNYDLGLDLALALNGVTPDYCLPQRPRNKEVPAIETALTPKEQPPSIKLLKLHGSLNWLPCKGERGECAEIAALPMREEYLQQDHDGTRRAWLRLTGWLRQCPHCHGPSNEPRPVIVPPTWNKTHHDHHRGISAVWREAAHALRSATTIVVLGYSLPPTDQFFRYLYALGTVGDARLQRFLVVDISAAAEETFQTLLGQGVTRRFMFRKYHFSQAMTLMSNFLIHGRPWPEGL